MVLSNELRLILGAVPFIAVLAGGWILGVVPDSSVIGKVLGIIAEENLSVLMKQNGFSKTSVTRYQLMRIVLAFALGFGITLVLDTEGVSGIIATVIAIAGMYKFFYVYLLWKDNARIKKLNTVLPYTIKSIAYLANVYPVNNALLKSIEIVPKEFREDIRMLCEDIDKDPASFAPYQAFIDRYDGRLNRLDYYLKTLYRMSMSATTEEVKLLTNLNETISEEMSTARKAKNDAVNSTVTWLGLIPVGLLTIMLLFLMVVISTAI